MTKAMLMLLLACCALAPATLPAQAQGDPARPTPTLKRAVTVSGDLVRIGDLVENAGEVAEAPIFRAPDIGTTGSVPTTKVLEAIRSHDLFGVDTGDILQVDVTRAGRSISAAQIEARIVQAFAGRYGLGDAESLVITVDREIRPLVVEPTVSGDLQIVRRRFEPRTGRFEVLFALPGSAIARRVPLGFTGTLVETAETMVTARPLARGDIVRASDLAPARRAKSELGGDIATGADEIVGRALRRPVRAGQLLRRADLVKPEIVKRDEMITLVYEVPGIVLTARGKALEAGGSGDVISVVNLQSKRTVQGVVTGSGRVAIQTAAAASVATAERSESPGREGE